RRGRPVRGDLVDVVHEALDVRPEHGDAAAKRGVSELGLQGSTGVAGLRETRRDHHDAANAYSTAVVDHPNDDSRGDDEDHEVDAAGQLEHRVEARPSPDLLVLGVDRVQLALVSDVPE